MDKFIGDGTMALFGILGKDSEGKEDAGCAAAAAIEFKEVFQNLMSVWIERLRSIIPQRVDLRHIGGKFEIYELLERLDV